MSRLLLGALIMHGINIVNNILTKSYINPITGEFSLFSAIGGNNIFWTFFWILCLFTVLDKSKKGANGALP